MDNRISVIISIRQEEENLVRCLNALRRQTFQNFEIIMVGNTREDLAERYHARAIRTQGQSVPEDLNEAVEKADGGYLYFCSVTSIPAPNTLEALLSDAKEEGRWTAGNYSIQDGNQFHISARGVLSIYGKLFERRRIMEMGLKFHKEYVMAEAVFVMEYMSRMHTFEVDENIFIYETDPKIFEAENKEAGPAELKQGMELLKKVPGDAGLLFVREVHDRCDNEESRKYICMETAHLPEEYRQLHYYMTKEWVKIWYERAMQNKDADAYENVRKYLLLFEQKADETMIHNVLGISAAQYQCMKKSTLEAYLFYRDKLSGNENYLLCVKELAQLKSLIKRQDDKLADLEKSMAGAYRREISKEDAGKEQGVHNVQELSGPALAEYIIQQYGHGGLGMKTILKSFGAWLKYKV